VDLNCPTLTPPYTNWSTAATNIQDAVDAVNGVDLILVTNGVYASGGRSVNGMSNRVAVTRSGSMVRVYSSRKAWKAADDSDCFLPRIRFRLASDQALTAPEQRSVGT
jgi:hypothetical protein